MNSPPRHAAPSNHKYKTIGISSRPDLTPLSVVHTAARNPATAGLLTSRNICTTLPKIHTKTLHHIQNLHFRLPLLIRRSANGSRRSWVKTRVIRWTRRISSVRARSRLRRRPKDNCGTWFSPVPTTMAGYPKYVLSEERVGIEWCVDICAAADAVEDGGGNGDGGHGDGDDDEEAFCILCAPTVSDEVENSEDWEPSSDERSGRYCRSKASYLGLGGGRCPPYSRTTGPM